MIRDRQTEEGIERSVLSRWVQSEFMCESPRRFRPEPIEAAKWHAARLAKASGSRFVDRVYFDCISAALQTATHSLMAFQVGLRGFQQSLGRKSPRLSRDGLELRS